MNEDVVNELVAAAEKLTVPLRMGRGLDAAALAEVRRALKQAGAEWQRESSIPEASGSHPRRVGSISRIIELPLSG